jgi:hypothetical protein
MHLGVDGVGHGAFDDEAAEGMANEDRVLRAGAVRFSRRLRNRGDGIVAIEVAREPFGRGFAAKERELPDDRHGRDLAAPSEIHADEMETGIANDVATD